MEDVRELVRAAALLVAWLLAYMAPTIVAHQRRHRQALAIGALNFLLGWTVIGWIVALVWGLTRDRVSVAGNG